MKTRRYLTLVAIVIALVLHAGSTITARRATCEEEYQRNVARADAEYDACSISVGVMAPGYCYSAWAWDIYNAGVERAVCEFMYE